MRKFLPVCVPALLLLALVAPARAQTPAFPPPAPEFPIPANATLTYAVDWRVFPAGTATFHLQAEGSNEHVTATAASIGTVNLLFPVADRYDSVFNRQTGCSYEYRKQIQEGRRRHTGLMQLDYGNHLQKLSEKNLVTEPQSTDVSHSGLRDRCAVGDFLRRLAAFQIGHDLQFPLPMAARWWP